jgi:hypothetical protein
MAIKGIEQKTINLYKGMTFYEKILHCKTPKKSGL